VIAIFTVLAVMIAVFWHLAEEQDDGLFSIEHITVEFGDEVIAFLGLFNGCYKARKDGPNMNRRLVYEQIGSGVGGGKFGYCENLQEDKSPGWIFFDGNPTDEEACKNYILRSGTTNTFDVLDASSNQWYTNDGQVIDYMQVSELPNSSVSSACGRDIFLKTIDSCDQLDIPVRFDSLQGKSSELFGKLVANEAQAGDSLDATKSHPIYLGTSTSEIILFTGRRWVLTTLEQISEEVQSLRDDAGWNHAAVADYLYNKGFRPIKQTQESNEWVLA